MSTVVKRRTKADALTSLTETVKQYATLSKQADLLNGRLNEVKDGLRTFLGSRLAHNDDRGHRWIELDPPINGVKSIKHERRVARRLDAERAETVLTKAGLLDECMDVAITIDATKMDVVLAALKKAGLYDEVVTTEEFISDDKIMQAYSAGNLSEAQVDSMFTDNVTWALKVGWVGQ